MLNINFSKFVTRRLFPAYSNKILFPTVIILAEIISDILDSYCAAPALQRLLARSVADINRY